MKNLELKLPPAAVWIICALIMWGITRLLPFLALPRMPLVAIAVAGIGIGIAFAGVWSFHKARTTINPLIPSQATHFVSKGVYQLSRNPMYVGLACCLIAWAIWLTYLLAWIGIPLFIVYMTHFQIIPEERVLKLKFGKEYENYCLKVHRWL
ncbi:isoprenylcysteine carboxylmethyltransferase family protein [Capnocytophaga bilenii]|uniref:methyltransferase family protein n=1 Tax=Capnocytophaga bilenii TaxID=2819369 RepID=UPI0028D2BABC|nr:isoprenylcysteine carboxylmethyltransferase family protein [Capnocytophaga bilenii]